MHVKIRLAIAALSFLLLCLSAVAEEQSSPEPEEPLPDNVLARVNGHDILIGDFNKSLLEMGGEAPLQFLIARRIVNQEQRARGLEIEEAAVDDAIEAFRAQIAPLTLQEYLKKAGISTPVFTLMIFTDVTAQTMMRADLGIPADQPILEEQAKAWHADLWEKAKVQLTRETKLDGVAAIVNEEPISTKQWAEITRQMTQPTIQVQVLEDLINKRLIRDQLEKAGIVITPEDMDREFAVRKRLFEADPRTGGISYEEYLARIGQSADSFRDSADSRLSLGVQRLVEKQLSEKDLEEYFNQHRERLAGAAVRASHILIRSLDPQTGGPDYQKALAKIREIKQKLDEGADFPAVAAELSEDAGTRGRGGELGLFRPGDMVEEFSKVAFSLEKGEVSEPVKTQFGYHLILVTETIPAKDVTLDDVKERIVRELTELRRPLVIKSLRESADIQRNVKLLQPMPVQ